VLESCEQLVCPSEHLSDSHLHYPIQLQSIELELIYTAHFSQQGLTVVVVVAILLDWRRDHVNVNIFFAVAYSISAKGPYAILRLQATLIGIETLLGIGMGSPLVKSSQEIPLSILFCLNWNAQ
jgi:hypothetical protein